MNRKLPSNFNVVDCVCLFVFHFILYLCACVSRYNTFVELEQIKFVSRNFSTKLTLCDHRNGNKAINKKAVTTRQSLFLAKTFGYRLPHKNPIIWFIESIPKFTDSFKTSSLFSVSYVWKQRPNRFSRWNFEAIHFFFVNKREINKTNGQTPQNRGIS